MASSAKYLEQQLTLKELKQLVKINGLEVKGDKSKKQSYAEALNKAIKYDESFFYTDQIDRQLVEDFETFPDFTLNITDVKLMTRRLERKEVDIDETFKKLSSRYGITTKIDQSKSYILQLEQVLKQVDDLFLNSPQINQFDFDFLDKLTPEKLPIKDTSAYAALAQLVVIELQCLVNEISYKEGIYDGKYILILLSIVQSMNDILFTLKEYYQELCEEQELKKTIEELLNKSPQHDLLLFLPDLSIEEVIEFINKAPQRFLTNYIFSRFVNRVYVNRNPAFAFYFVKAVKCTLKQNYLNHLVAYYEEIDMYR